LIFCSEQFKFFVLQRDPDRLAACVSKERQTLLEGRCMLAPANPEVADLLAWHQVTDEYAIALDALRRGEPTARVQVQALYLKLRRLMDFSSAKTS
jgi:predicted metal-dependent hydrolase